MNMRELKPQETRHVPLYLSISREWTTRLVVWGSQVRILSPRPFSPQRQSSSAKNPAVLHIGDYILDKATPIRSEEHTSELQSLMRISYAVFCLKKKTQTNQRTNKPLLTTNTNTV